jgi:serine protease Do
MRKSMLMVLTASLALPAGAAEPSKGLTETEQAIAMAAEATDGALALLRFEFENELGSRTLSGQAVCIRPSGVFMTLAMNSNMEREQISKLELVMPGVGGQTHPATLIGIDAETGIGFVQAGGKQTWKAVRFAKSAKLYIGQMVCSAGLMPQTLGNLRSLSVAYVSTMLRAPERLVYVTAGKLTQVGSPVLNKEGQAIGVVWRQVALERQFVALNRQAVPVRTADPQETSFFVPVDEFADAIAEPGRRRKLSWIGVVDLKAVGKDVAGVLKENQHGIQLNRIVPGTPAANAGLKDGDVIVGLNDKPVEALATPLLTARNFYRTIQSMAPGTALKLQVFRDGQTLPKALKTAEMPTRPAEAERFYSAELGLGVRNRVMLDGYLDDSPKSKAMGVIVYAVKRDGPAHWATALQNDVITKVGETAVTSVEAFEVIVKNALADKTRKRLELTVMRGDRQHTLRIPLPSR